jgi:hypothetical protein
MEIIYLKYPFYLIILLLYLNLILITTYLFYLNHPFHFICFLLFILKVNFDHFIHIIFVLINYNNLFEVL